MYILKLISKIYFITGISHKKYELEQQWVMFSSHGNFMTFSAQLAAVQMGSGWDQTSRM